MKPNIEGAVAGGARLLANTVFQFPDAERGEQESFGVGKVIDGSERGGEWVMSIEAGGPVLGAGSAGARLCLADAAHCRSSIIIKAEALGFIN